MTEKPGIEQVRSLATVRDGETLVVEHILFDSNRARLAAAGITEGDRVRCRVSTPTHVYLETEVGIVVGVERDWADFVQVAHTEETRRERMLERRPALG